MVGLASSPLQLHDFLEVALMQLAPWNLNLLVLLWSTMTPNANCQAYMPCRKRTIKIQYLKSSNFDCFLFNVTLNVCKDVIQEQSGHETTGMFLVKSIISVWWSGTVIAIFLWYCSSQEPGFPSKKASNPHAWPLVILSAKKKSFSGQSLNIYLIYMCTASRSQEVNQVQVWRGNIK